MEAEQSRVVELAPELVADLRHAKLTLQHLEAVVPTALRMIERVCAYLHIDDEDED